MLENILNLADWVVYGVRESAEGYQFTCAYPSITLCPQGHGEAALHRFGSRDQIFLDLPMHGKRVALLVHRQRYRCTACGKTFWQAVPDMDERRWMTVRLKQYIQSQALRRTFVSIAAEIGLDEKTIRNIFHDHLVTLEAAHAAPTPTWLGIDELTLAGKPRCILTNLQEGSVFDLLASRTQATVTAYLRALPRREDVAVICMDMWMPYKTACQICLPQARLIVDKFHVVRMANQALESVRKTLRASLSDRQRRTLMHDRYVLLRRQGELSAKDQLILESWQGALPLLAQAYRCKEAFYEIWDASTETDARQRYTDWRQRLPAELAEAFAPLTTAMGNWHTEIFS